MTWRTFFDAVIIAKAKCRSLLLPERRLSRRGVNATGRVVRGAAVARARAVRGTDVTPGFGKANRMRTMYVPGSELTYTAIT
jgi:hypothetical protein